MSSGILQKIQIIDRFLAQLNLVTPLTTNSRGDLIFEAYCYFRKARELADRGKTPVPCNTSGGVFAPHSKPGNPRTASYISFEDPLGEDLNLYLNCSFSGKSRVEHSPDIVLTRSGTREDVVSVYECKNHSGRLGLTAYREFLGYCLEMRLLSIGPGSERLRTLRGAYPESKPCIYTSSLAHSTHRKIGVTYGFDVIDQL